MEKRYVLKVWYQWGHPRVLFDKFVGETMNQAIEKYLIWAGGFDYGESYIERIEVWEEHCYGAFNDGKCVRIIHDSDPTPW